MLSEDRLLGVVRREADPRKLAVIRMATGVVIFAKGLHLGYRVLWGIPTVPGHVSLVLAGAVLALLACSVALTLGAHARRSAGCCAVVGLFFLTFASTLCRGCGFSLYSNHLYLLTIVAFLVSLSQCDRVLALRPGTYDEPPGEWPLFLMRVQLSIVYGFAAVNKVHLDFLTGSVVSYELDGSIFAAVAPAALMSSPAVFVTLAVLVVAAEGFLAYALWSRRLRRAGLATMAVLHVAMISMSSRPGLAVEIAIFGAAMFVLAMAFVEGRRVPEQLPWRRLTPPPASDGRRPPAGAGCAASARRGG